MLRKIKLYGELAKFLGQKTFEAEVNNAAQAIKFLVVNFPQLEKHMADRYYKVAVGNWELTKEELTYPNGQEEIKIIPVVGGAGGRGGFGRFLMGAVLIGIGIASGGATFGAGGFTGVGFLGGTTALVGNVGIALALGGIAQMLTPVETIPEKDQDLRLSFNFSGIQNTSRAGIAVPVIYGEILTGSFAISAGIETAQVEV